MLRLVTLFLHFPTDFGIFQRISAFSNAINFSAPTAQGQFGRPPLFQDPLEM
jgi:hypothetical protein